VSALYIGLMSGTSMDGIDAVLVDLAEPTPKVLASTAIPWSPTLRERLQAAARGSFLTADQFAQLDAETGEAFAAAANAVVAGHTPDEILAIGSHGQTLAHAPNSEPGYSLQIGCPSLIAERTGITTVADFRRRDIAAGGQGAPLVPAFHRAVFQTPEEDRVIINIGGIANITHLPAMHSQATVGFDTGPGNCLMDHWIMQQQGKPFDANGEYAAQGEVNEQLLARMLADPYFEQSPPKSTGTDYFSPRWLSEAIGTATIASHDIQATALELTARTIAASVRSYCQPTPQRAIICGGGVHNRHLMTALSAHMPCRVEGTQTLGMDPDWVEAIAFAWLAKQTLHGRSGNLPSVTGARGPRILGAVYAA